MATTLADPKLLQKIDELRERNIGQHIPLPQLVVVGDQSSGKSSVLESLTGTAFPRDLELCTRYATQITSRRDAVSKVEVVIVPGPDASDTHRQNLEAYKPVLSSIQEFKAQFPSILEQVNIRMGIKLNRTTDKGRVFSEDVLKIEICAPDADYLTVIDVPGIFRTPTEGVTTKDDIKMVKKMVRRYMKNPRTIILAVLPCNIDIATQEVLSIAEEYDTTGERTLGILTKPDLVTERSAQQGVCNLVLGKRRQLVLGYNVIRNRGADEDSSFDFDNAEQFFRNEPWSTLPEDRVGIEALRARLTELLSEITRKEFPKLRKEIQAMLQVCETMVAELGPSRATEQEQRIFLSTMASNFKTYVDAAISAHYSRHDAFDEHDDLRLITAVVNITGKFSQYFELRAHLYEFDETEMDSSSDQSVENASNEDSEGGKITILADDLSDFEYGDQYDMLDGVLAPNTEVALPKDDILTWVKALYVRSRGATLGSYGDGMLSSAFREQSAKWSTIINCYMSSVICKIHGFLVTLLKIICPDDRVREELWAALQDDILQRYKGAMAHAEFHVGVERHQGPYTLNQYFNESLQTARGARKAKELRSYARKETKRNHNGLAVTSDNLIIDFERLQSASTHKDNVEQDIEDIHDILFAYYEVARQRIVDNVYRYAVDHALLTGPNSPLSYFSQEWAIKLDANQLERIAGESTTGKAKREALHKKMKTLQEAMQILRR